MKAASYTKSGNKAAEVTLDKAVFGVAVKPELVAAAYDRYMSNKRTNNAKTLTRGLVAGGGKKPWRQKGTGRARTGSIRNPIWRGGGVIFGPTGQENHTKQMPRKMSRAALVQALSLKSGSTMVIDSFRVDQYSTRAASGLMSKMGLEGQILIVVGEIDEKTAKSVANIAGVSIVSTSSLNVVNVMNADVILFEKAALDKVTTWLRPTIKKEVAK